MGQDWEGQLVQLVFVVVVAAVVLGHRTLVEKIGKLLKTCRFWLVPSSTNF